MDASEVLLSTLEADPEAKAAGSELVTTDPEAEMVASKAVTAGFEAEIAGSEAVTAGSKAVSAGSKAVIAGSKTVTADTEAGMAGSEAVTVGSKAVTADPEAGTKTTDYIYRLPVILTELILVLKEELALKPGKSVTDGARSAPGLIQALLGRGAPEDPVPEEKQVAARSRRVQYFLKVIQELGAESEKTNVMIRMALLTAAICYEALPAPALTRLRRARRRQPMPRLDLNDPLIHLLLSYVIVRTEHTELFEKFLKNHGSVLDVNCFNSKGFTPLYVAIKNNNLEMVKAILELRSSIYNITKENESALHIAVDHPIVLKYLVKHRCIPDTGCYNKSGYTPIHIAVISKQLHQFELIADARTSYLYETMEKEDKTCLHLAVENESIEIVEAIFKRLERHFGYREYSKYIITSLVDENGYTPFHAALQGKNKDIIELFLRNGGFLSEKRNDESTALEIIATHFNDASSILCNAFDDSISISTTSGENTIDYSSFSDIKDTSQINVIEKIVQCGQSDLLLHPLIQSYVYLKWNYFLPLFYFMISVHAIFLITFNVLVANMFYYRDTSNGTVLTNQTSSCAVPWSQQKLDWRYWTLITLMYTIFTVLIVQEAFTIYIKRQQWQHHFAHRETWIRLLFLVLAVFLPVELACAEPADWQRHAACAALLLGWLQAMFLLSRFPSWGNYVLMFGRVAVNLLKILASMLFLIIGFSFCFMIQYRSTPPFDGPAAAFFKTLVMMSSEFDYEDLFGEDHAKELRDTILVVRLLFGLFVVFVAIALMNFMTGAAVSDINELTIMADKRRLEKQVQLLSTIEAIVYEGAFSKMFRKFFVRGRYYKRMTYSTTKVTKWKVVSLNVLEKDNGYNDDCEGLCSNLNNNTATGSKMSPFTCKIGNVNITKRSFEVRPSVKLNEDFVKIYRKKDRREEKKNVYITKNKIEELHDAFLDKPKEGQEKGNKDWVLEVISRQDERLKSLSDDLLQVTRAHKQMRCLIGDINSSIQELTLKIKMIAKEIKKTRRKSLSKRKYYSFLLNKMR